MTTVYPESRAGAGRAGAWVDEPIEAVAAALATDPVAGLAADDAARRLARDGANEIQTSKPPSKLAIAVAQFRSLLVWILLGAAGIATTLGEWTEELATLLVVAAKAGLDRAAIEASMPRLETVPFDSDRKRMTVVRLREGRPWAFVKGAPEVILERCGLVYEGGGTRPLTEGNRAAMARASTLLASDALRVLALAERPMESSVVPDTPSAAGRAERDLPAGV